MLHGIAMIAFPFTCSQKRKLPIRDSIAGEETTSNLLLFLQQSHEAG